MENSSDQQPTPGKPAGLNLYILGFALLATLVAGVAIGLLINRPAANSQVVVTATPDPGNQTVAQATTQNASEASGDTNSAPTPTIMDFVLSDARHFQGSPDAPITLVEFSDFK